MHKRAGFSLWMVPALFVIVCPMFLNGSPQMAEDKDAKQSVTGCLQKGDESGGFTITDKDGKVWELRSKMVKLSGHVGHTVTVTGSATARTKAEEAKIEASEKKEAGGSEHGDLQVSGLRMVSESCK